MVVIKDFNAPRNCVDCQNEDLSEMVGCGLFAECGKHPNCPIIEIKEGDCINRQVAIDYLCKNMYWYDGNGSLADDTTKRNAITDLVNGITSIFEREV